MGANEGRRQFLGVAALAGAGVALVGASTARADDKGAKTPSGGKPADINATEDLMREHGVLRRVLLVYGEGIRRIAAGSAPKADLFASAAGLVKRFVEGYHEKLEEEQVFPRMEKAGKLVELAHTLKVQHEAGRALTAEILKNATPAGLGNASQRQAMVAAIEKFIRMYEPHAAREDTVLFPAFHDLFTEKEFDALGDQFEEQEHKLLGSGGFEGALKEVEQMEKSLGIYDLAQFTPK